MSSPTATDRELVAEIDIAASPEKVWATATDVRQMPAWSPELVKMLPLKPGGLRVGQWYLGVNRRKAVVWPTRNVVSAVEVGRRFAFDTTSSGARWIFELSPSATGTRLVQRRPVPKKLTGISKIFARLFLGGAAAHADELEDGMRRTLAGIKAAAEA